MQVHKCTEEDRLLSQRLALTVDQRGIVLDTSASPSNLFGFEPQSELIGLPLAAFINVFEEFRIKQQKQQQGLKGTTARAAASSSLSGDRAANEQYSRLALQIGPGRDAAGSAANGAASAAAAAGSDDDSILLTLLAHAAHEGSEACYRVGVRANPLAADQIGKTAQQQQAQNGQESGGGSSLLQALGNRRDGRLKPALMRVDVVDPDWSQEDAAGQGVRFKVQKMLLCLVCPLGEGSLQHTVAGVQEDKVVAMVWQASVYRNWQSLVCGWGGNDVRARDQEIEAAEGLMFD